MARNDLRFAQITDLDLQGRYGHSDLRWVGDTADAGNPTFNSIAYQQGDVVVYEGHLYIALSDNDNIQPSTNPGVWQNLTDTDSLVEPIPLPADPDRQDILATVRLERGNIAGSTTPEDFIVFTSFQDAGNQMPTPVPGFVYRLTGMIGNSPVDGTFLGTDIVQFPEFPASPNIMSWRVLHSALVDLPGGAPLPAVRTTIGITDIANPTLFVVGYQTPPRNIDGYVKALEFTGGANPVGEHDLAILPNETVMFHGPTRVRSFTNITNPARTITVSSGLPETETLANFLVAANFRENPLSLREYDIPDTPVGDAGDGGIVTWQPNEIKTFRGGPANAPGFIFVVQNFARTTDSATNLGDDITLVNGVLSITVRGANLPARAQDSREKIARASRYLVLLSTRPLYQDGGLELDEFGRSRIDASVVNTRWDAQRTYNVGDQVHLVVGTQQDRTYRAVAAAAVGRFPLTAAESMNLTPWTATVEYPDFSLIRNSNDGGSVWQAQIGQSRSTSVAPTGNTSPGWQRITAFSTGNTNRVWQQLLAGGSAINIQDEGEPVGSQAADTLNFVGPNVDVTGDGSTKTVTITGVANEPAIVNTAGLPTLASGITAEEVRIAINAAEGTRFGETLNFFDAYELTTTANVRTIVLRTAQGQTLPPIASLNREEALVEVTVSGTTFRFGIPFDSATNPTTPELVAGNWVIRQPEFVDGNLQPIMDVANQPSDTINPTPATIRASLISGNNNPAIEDFNGIPVLASDVTPESMRRLIGAASENVEIVDGAAVANQYVSGLRETMPGQITVDRAALPDGDDFVTREIQRMRAEGTTSNSLAHDGNRVITIGIPSASFEARVPDQFLYRNILSLDPGAPSIQSPIQVGSNSGNSITLRGPSAVMNLEAQVTRAGGYPLYANELPEDAGTEATRPTITGRVAGTNIFTGSNLQRFSSTSLLYVRDVGDPNPEFSVTLDTGQRTVTGRIPVGTNRVDTLNLIRNAIRDSGFYPLYTYTLTDNDDGIIRIGTNAETDIEPTITYTGGGGFLVTVTDADDNNATSTYTFTAPDSTNFSISPPTGRTRLQVSSDVAARINSDTILGPLWMAASDPVTGELTFARRSRLPTDGLWMATSNNPATTHTGTRGDLSFEATAREPVIGGQSISGFSTGLTVSDDGIVTVDSAVNPPDQPPQLTAAMQDFQNNLSLVTDNTRSSAAWGNLGSPYAVAPTRIAAAYWDENRRTFGTGNYFADLNGSTTNVVFSAVEGATRYFPNPVNPANTLFPGATSYYEALPVTLTNGANGTLLPAGGFRRIMLFDVDPNFSQRGTHSLLSIGQAGSTDYLPILQFNHVEDNIQAEGEGISVRVGITHGGSRTYTRNVPIFTTGQSAILQYSGIAGNTTPISGSFVLPANHPTDGTSRTYRLSFQLDDNGVDIGTATVDYTVGLPNNSIASRTEQVDPDGVGDFAPHPFDISYNGTNREIIISGTFNNNTLTWTVGATYSETATWTPATTFTDFPVIGTAHLGDSNQLSQIAIVFEPNNIGDTIANPENSELGIKLVINGQYRRSYNLGRAIADYDFSRIQFGNSQVSTARIQVYGYNGNNGVTERDLLAMYNSRSRWIGAFERNTEHEQHYSLNRLMQFNGRIDGPGTPFVQAQIIRGSAPGTYEWQFTGDAFFTETQTTVTGRTGTFPMPNDMVNGRFTLQLPNAVRVGAETTPATGVTYQFVNPADNAVIAEGEPILLTGLSFTTAPFTTGLPRLTGPPVAGTTTLLWQVLVNGVVHDTTQVTIAIT